mgnify:CR=1 FL=1
MVPWVTAVTQNDQSVTFTLDPSSPDDVYNWTIEMVVHLTDYGIATSNSVAIWMIDV